MNDNIKKTFDTIHAEEALKDSTKAFLFQKTQAYSACKTTHRQYLAAMAACLILILSGYGGYRLYFTPTAIISIDINPSLELGVNRFRKIISVDEYNDDGQILARSLNIKFMDYTDAVNQLLETKYMTDLLSQDEVLVITVSGSYKEQSAQILTDVESCTAHHQNTYCYSADSAKTAEAHNLGLSCGKYHAYLTLQSLNLDITPEEVQGMTMREIRDLISTYSGSGEDNPIEDDPIEDDSTGNGHHGENHGHHHP